MLVPSSLLLRPLRSQLRATTVSALQLLQLAGRQTIANTPDTWTTCRQFSVISSNHRSSYMCDGIVRPRLRTTLSRSLHASAILRQPTTPNEESANNGKTNPTKKDGADGLLSETVVSDKKQRQADWAILKEMIKYLWPKASNASTANI
ncbi:hypothetical protein V1517DRAFT_304598 [Lipomyces orientalis]|uniref:Uncharacterized protein n=1 Tax=Lipomyces orientalis TaxID=1233043 RepID=A0ACC3TZ36_9ASCO